MVQNAGKIYNSPTRGISKPWYFFHIVYSGDAGNYLDSLELYKNHSNYQLWENIIEPNNRKKFLTTLLACMCSILPNNIEGAINRLETEKGQISDLTCKNTLTEQLLRRGLSPPIEVLKLVEEDALTISQCKKLSEIRKFMVKSPQEFIDKMIKNYALATITNNWTINELSEKVENSRFNYTIDRARMNDLNVEHDNVIAKTGSCLCVTLSEEEIKQGVSVDKVYSIIAARHLCCETNRIHVWWFNHPEVDEFWLYFTILNLYGINYRDNDKLDETEEEILWMLRTNTKWTTNDKGLCWNCGEQPMEIELFGVSYCRKCAHEIIDERLDIQKN